LIGAVVSLALTACLAVRLIAIDNAGAFVILVPAMVGSLLALVSKSRMALVLASLLTAITGVVSLIGGIGLLYFPSIALFVSASISDRRIPSRGG
jgi:hypothetical protein